MDEIPIKGPGLTIVPRIVSGVVREADGTPIPNARVEAFDEDLRALNPLGQQQSGRDGSYRIEYTASQLKRPGKTSADLVVKASLAGGAAIAQSPTLFHAPPSAVIDLTRNNQPYLGPAELTAVQTTLAPALGRISAATLTATDIDYLTGDTGVTKLQIEHLATAAQSGGTSQIDAHVFYGLARKGFPVTLDRVLSTDPAAQQQTLEAAAKANLIPPSLAQNIPQLVAQMQQTAVSRTVAPGATRLGGSLAVSLSDAKQQSTFVSTFLANRTSGEAFWKALAGQPGFTAEVVATTQLGVQLASLTQYHAPLVTALTQQHQQGKIRSIADLARLETADWLNLIHSKNAAGAVIGVPPGVPGANASEMAANYAEALTRRLETAFPTVAVSARLAKSRLAGAGAVSAFLDAHPDFDIAATNAVTYAAEKKAPAQVAQSLPAMQRVFKVAPRFAQMEPLLAAGLNSARAIAGMPLEQFVTQFGGALGGTLEAQSVYARSQVFAQSSVQLYGQYATGLNGNNPRTLGGAPDSAPQVANWTALFGSPDFCACSDCQSILSPAAYLVDLLNTFVNPFISDGTHKGTELLFARRPDIGTLQLSCENTNTTLPYIDLVNELLENAVAPGTATKHDSTDGSPDDLGASPEYLNQQAYTTLAQQVFPWSLPFDLGLSQARLYLGNLDVKRDDLMQAFLASPGTADPTDAAITNSDAVAADALGLSPLGWKILTGASGHQPWDVWGVSNADWTSVWTKAAPGPTVQQFLTQASIAFADLVDLLTTGFAQKLAPAPNAVVIQWADVNGESCDLAQATVLNLSAPVLDGFLRFLRLRNALGASVLDTDKLVAALGATFDASFVQRATATAKLKTQLNLPWPELASWWGPIPTMPDSAGGTSLYQRLFLNPAITNPLDGVFGLNASGTELADTSHFLEDAAHQPTLLAGLQISATDLNLLVASLPLAMSGGQHKLNLANLSELYRVTSLARAMQLGIADFLTAAAVFKLNLDPSSGATPAPFNPAHVSDALWAIRQAAFVQASGFSLADLNYLLLDSNAATSALAPALSDLAQQLTNLCTGLQPILTQTGGMNPAWSTQAGAFVAQQLAGWLSLPIPAMAAWLATTPAGFSKSYQDTFLDPAFVKTAPPIPVSAVSSALAAPVPPPPAPPLYYQARALIKLKKIATIANRLKLQTPELAWLQANAGSLAWLDLNALPAFGAAPPPLYEGWAKLVTMCQLRGSLTPGEPFPKLMPGYPKAAAPPEAVYLATLSTLTGWDTANLQTVCGSTGLNFTYPDDFWQPASFTRIQTVFGLLGKLGATAQQVLPWTHAAITLQQANDITTLVKGHYTVAQWPATGKKLRDPLRQQQRDALSAYLIFNSPALFKQQFTSTDDLFGYFLIDTQMASCMQTSRIIQATQSIQTYVSRCLLNLESGVTVAQAASQYWTWMKQYRVWQANREVFLYPENWLDPSLRDDQTTYFQTLAAAMKKKAVTEAVVEDAFLAYLTSLDGVSRLQVCGMYHDLDPANAIDTLHVFGRTPGSPSTYYLRTFVNSSYWTEWEKVDLDIPGVDVIPVIYNRRLYVFWPVIKTLSAQVKTMSAPNPGDQNYQPTPTPTWAQIQIGWSQYWQGKWAAKKISDAPGLLVPISPTLVGSGLVPSQNEAYFSPPFNCIYPSALRADGTVDSSYFQFKAVPPPANDTSDQMHLSCYVVYWGQTANAASFGYSGLWLGKFIISGCHEHATLTNSPAATDLPLLAPPNTVVTGMQFDNFAAQSLTLPVGSASAGDTSVTQVADQLQDISVLGSTPGDADTLIVYPHQYTQFGSQDSFFQQDGKHTFFVTPKLTRYIWNWNVATSTVFANLSAPVSYYASSYIPAVNTPPLESTVTLVSAAGASGSATTGPVVTRSAMAVVQSSFQATNVMASGILSWGGAWYPPAPVTFWITQFNYQPFYHPYVCDFIRAVKQFGIDGLLKWPNPSSTPLQLLSNDYFAATYNPKAVLTPYPQDNVDFTYSGSYSQYNWELFYHAPMLLAAQLSQNQQFEDAQRWLHYIFDPTSFYPAPPPGAASAFPYGYWKVKPFYEQTTESSITQLLTLLDSSAPGHQDALQNFQQQVAVSMSQPFEPFAIARLRTTAFQKAAVMKYLDNLIAWADNLFRQDTRETINESTQLYILADQLLGPKPQEVNRDGSAPLAYNDLAQKFVSGDLSDPLVQLENALPVTPGQLAPQVPLPYAPTPISSALYFCVPPNPQILSYWDTVADRLYKIRHCQNIEGQVQQLPLLAPPINPALLIQAAAAGVDLSAVLAAFTAPPPLFHFPYLYKQAIDFCKEVHTLGSMLQAALEKDDAEALAALRATQEASLLGAMRQEYVERLQQAMLEQIDLGLYRQRVQDKHDWYVSQPQQYPGEPEALGSLDAANQNDLSASDFDTVASVAALVPDFDIGGTGAGGSPTAKVKYGGKNVASAAKYFGDRRRAVSSSARDSAGQQFANARIAERNAKYALEILLAQDELNEIDSTKTAIAALKVTMAQTQLDNFDTKTQDAQNVAQFLLSKFTNQQLYDWMVAQISGVYFQSYQLAYQMAKRAEAAYNYDLGNYDAAFVSFIQPSYWDNLHQGLLAAEGLTYDVERMESSWVDNFTRDFEIIRPISLSQLDSTAFNTLITTGKAFFNLPESLFDADYPGHYMRRIKYAGVGFNFSTAKRPAYVNCTLTLMSSSIRTSPTPATPYARSGPGDTRFHDLNAVQQVVTSNGGTSATSPDNGMFETTVHYIITDDRLLTFEHSGVIGTWEIEFSKNNPGFDPTIVTDIVLQLEYMSRYGGDALKTAAGG